MGDYEEAESLCEEYRNDQADFQYGRLIVESVKFTRGEREEKELDKYLVNALENNLYLPDMLLSNSELPPAPIGYMGGSGEPEQAIRVARTLKEVWDRIKGLGKWLESTKVRGGCKPPTSREMFDILGAHVVLIVLRDGPTLRVTTNVQSMIGRGLPTFQVPSGTKDHAEGEPIKMFENSFRRDVDKWHTIDYQDIVEVPFWDVFSKCQPRTNQSGYCSECYKSQSEHKNLKLKRCGRCKVATYCSEDCQRNHWNGKGKSLGKHKDECRRWTKT